MAESEALTVQDTPISLSSPQPSRLQPSGRRLPCTAKDHHNDPQVTSLGKAQEAAINTADTSGFPPPHVISHQHQHTASAAHRKHAPEAETSHNPMQDPTMSNDDDASAASGEGEAQMQTHDAGPAGPSAMEALYEARVAVRTGPALHSQAELQAGTSSRPAPVHAADASLTALGHAHSTQLLPPNPRRAQTDGAQAVGRQKARPFVDHGPVIVLDDADTPSQEDASISIGGGSPRPVARSGGTTSTQQAAASGSFTPTETAAEGGHSHPAGVMHDTERAAPRSMQTDAAMPSKSQAVEFEDVGPAVGHEQAGATDSAGGKSTSAAAAMPQQGSAGRNAGQADDALQQTSGSGTNAWQPSRPGVIQQHRPTLLPSAPTATSNVLWGRNSGHAYQVQAGTGPHAGASKQATSAWQPTRQQDARSGSNTPSGNSSRAGVLSGEDANAQLTAGTEAAAPSQQHAGPPDVVVTAASERAVDGAQHEIHTQNPSRLRHQSSAAASHSSQHNQHDKSEQAATATDQGRDESSSQPADDPLAGPSLEGQQAVPPDLGQEASDADDSEPASADEGGSEAGAAPKPEPTAGKGLASNIASQLRSFLTMGASKGEAAPAAGKKPVKVQPITLTTTCMLCYAMLCYAMLCYACCLEASMGRG